jgi:hypothetical protein
VHQNSFFLSENFLKFFYFFYFWNILKKTEYFNTRFLSYSVNIQTDIMQNW